MNNFLSSLSLSTWSTALTLITTFIQIFPGFKKEKVGCKKFEKHDIINFNGNNKLDIKNQTEMYSFLLKRIRIEDISYLQNILKLILGFIFPGKLLSFFNLGQKQGTLKYD